MIRSFICWDGKSDSFQNVFCHVVLESLIDSSELVRPKRPALSYVVLEILNHSRESGHVMIHANEWINNSSSLYYCIFNLVIESIFDLVYVYLLKYDTVTLIAIVHSKPGKKYTS